MCFEYIYVWHKLSICFPSLCKWHVFKLYSCCFWKKSRSFVQFLCYFQIHERKRLLACIFFSPVRLAHFLKCIFVFVCVCARVCVRALHFFAFVFLHGCVSILTFPHSVGKWEAESRETSCWIHTIWKTRRKRAGLTLRSTWRLWRLLWYQPSFYTDLL